MSTGSDHRLPPETDPGCSKMREAVAQNLGPAQLVHLLTGFENVLWPGGELRPPSVPRTAEEKARTRDIAFRQLMVLMPGTFSSSPLLRSLNQGMQTLPRMCSAEATPGVELAVSSPSARTSD